MTNTNHLLLFWLEKKVVFIVGVTENNQIYRVEKCNVLNVNRGCK